MIPKEVQILSYQKYIKVIMRKTFFFAIIKVSDIAIFIEIFCVGRIPNGDWVVGYMASTMATVLWPMPID